MLKGIVSGSPVDIKRIAMKGASLLNPDTQWLPLKVSAGVYQGTITQFYALDFKIPQNLVGKTLTARCYIDGNLSGTNIRWRFKTGSTTQDSGSISSSGYITLTFTCLTDSDTIRVYYGTGGTRTVTITEFMLNEGSSPLPYEPYGMQPGWEVRDQQGTILWAADKTLTGTDSIPIKGYGLPLTDYKVEADMTVPATQEYSIEGTSSIDYQSNGTALTDLEFQGNMVQSGTPSSSSPIYPSEMGERTGNLLNLNRTYSNLFTTDTTKWFIGAESNNNANIGATASVSDGNITVTSTTAGYGACFIIPAEPQTEYTISFDTNKVSSGSYFGYSFRNASGEVIFQSTISSKSAKLTTYANTAFIDLCFRLPPSDGETTFSNIMLNSGQTPLPYEPYGYKIPFSNGQTSYNVYLTEPLRKIGDYADRAGMVLGGKRKIKKLVLTGQESTWSQDGSSSGVNRYRVKLVDAAKMSGTYSDQFYISHYERQSSSTYAVNKSFIYSSSPVWLYINVDNAAYPTADDYKAFIASQYAAGAPVCVWYVLDTETTDPVTFPTVTPAQGANTMSVSTTLAPSKTRLTATSGVWPKNPIWPAEFGEPTVNLLDTSLLANNKGLSANGGVIDQSGRVTTTTPIDVTSLSNVTLTFNCAYTCSFIYALFNGSTLISREAGNSSGTTIDTSSGDKLYICFYATQNITKADVTSIMLNSGSTALPYEPYGQFKIPITCGGNTYNVFTTAPLRKIGSYADYEQLSVGEGRKIVKLVLDGTEDWALVGVDYIHGLYIAQPPIGNYEAQICSHYAHANSWAELQNTNNSFGISSQNRIVIHDESIRTSANFKAFLAQEYAAGHPVTIWYVLATEQTTPTQLPTITPTDGNDTFAVNTTVPPSAVTITGHVKARGT